MGSTPSSLPWSARYSAATGTPHAPKAMPSRWSSSSSPPREVTPYVRSAGSMRSSKSTMCTTSGQPCSAAGSNRRRGSEGEVDGLLPRGGRAGRQSRAKGGALERHLHEHGELGDSCIALACIAMLTMPPMPPDMDVNPGALERVTGSTTGVHGLTTTVTTADPPAAVACGALRQIERLLNVDDELAVVRVGLRGRGSATHGAAMTDA